MSHTSCHYFFLILSESLMSLNPNLSGFEDQSVV